MLASIFIVVVQSYFIFCWFYWKISKAQLLVNITEHLVAKDFGNDQKQREFLTFTETEIRDLTSSI